MTSPLARNPLPLSDLIPIHDPHLLATLWERQELGDWLEPLNVIAEHIDLNNADLTIVAWEQLLSLIQDIDGRYSLNMDNVRKNVVHLGIELPAEGEGIDAFPAVLAQIYVTDTTRFTGVTIHLARHLVCNIGVLRACTVVKAAYMLGRSTYALEPTAGLLELKSQLDRHQQLLSCEVFEFQKRKLLELSDRGHDLEAFELMIELRDFRRLGMAYWKVDGLVISSNLKPA